MAIHISTIAAYQHIMLLANSGVETGQVMKNKTTS
ncbi:hypothetical protein EHW99_0585 [Erwinia amylovora]|uniref:Uncharacterized protein n=2 Tax=Erwinia amylovora TaxID=552 RepID=A0A831A0Y4_ERWAM|nr:hypothetical protein EaACW_3046 [Erwinia amylovora ACW56400]QJQ53292.1 hypothetical protein EHX00_0585 [Erwinia amylovora]CBA22867.1 hypothetical protein predicted by Glimmer/Critica [Erwinia amylovora CFBP1430]CCO79887.1 hypothetical protein BN432_3108 [Erwinia amylovora Ea356]CCO83693.1 hypothetical protein BN433_3136 [Erwinia amylovora Ea266]CCO87451.1 hypothetical protein BN434_3082 [Erwinia amylovora CFBP 2585]CCO91247.1 hypothetical protein BN435_3095 [Erwinia amylovora 01SFR-BO]CCO